MSKEKIREKLDHIIKEKNLSYREVSQAIGRSDQYIQQYIKYGLPAKLKAEDRYEIAKFLNIDEQELSDTPLLKPLSKVFENSVLIDMLDATACCGNGIECLQENVIGFWNMPYDDFRTITTTSKPENVKLLRVKGDSMSPTIKDGDWVMADISLKQADSDGIYLLRMSTGLAIKRLQGSVKNDVLIISDNPKYPTVTADSGEVTILGKVIYTLNAEKVG